MAIKRVTIETRLSDLSGEETADVETVTFKVDGTTHKIDLTAQERKTFSESYAPYVAAAIAAKGSNGGNSADDEGPAIRQWAKDHGYNVSDMGKLSASVKSAYFAAQAQPGNGQTVVDGNAEAEDETPAKGSKK